ncbi:MAG: hypothetical protein K8R68_10725, partial [Bacteroidales bacterium]|nr:hypothetical protein [Bacteroidales bacterium]
MKRTLNITIWAIIIAGILVLVSFIETEYRKTTCKNFEIFIDYQDANPLISVEEITKKVYVKFDTVIGKKLSDINSKNIENLVNKINFIENAEVYTTLTGNMKIKVTQRNPIIKIINSASESFYMDQNGILMPASREFTSRVLIVNG